MVTLSVISLSIGFGLTMDSVGAGLIVFGICGMLMAPLIFSYLGDN